MNNQKESLIVYILHIYLNKPYYWITIIFFYFGMLQTNNSLRLGYSLLAATITTIVLLLLRIILLKNKINKTVISKKMYFFEITRNYALKKSIDKEYLTEFENLITAKGINKKIKEIIEKDKTLLNIINEPVNFKTKFLYVLLNGMDKFLYFIIGIIILSFLHLIFTRDPSLIVIVTLLLFAIIFVIGVCMMISGAILPDLGIIKILKDSKYTNNESSLYVNCIEQYTIKKAIDKKFFPEILFAITGECNYEYLNKITAKEINDLIDKVNQEKIQEEIENFSYQKQDIFYYHQEYYQKIIKNKPTIDINKLTNTNSKGNLYNLSMKINEFQFILVCINNILSIEDYSEKSPELEEELTQNFSKKFSEERVELLIINLFKTFIPIINKYNINFEDFSLEKIDMTYPRFIQSFNATTINELKDKRLRLLKEHEITEEFTSVQFSLDEEQLITLHTLLNHCKVTDFDLIKIGFIFNLNVKWFLRVTKRKILNRGLSTIFSRFWNF